MGIHPMPGVSIWGKKKLTSHTGEEGLLANSLILSFDIRYIQIH